MVGRKTTGFLQFPPFIANFGFCPKFISYGTFFLGAENHADKNPFRKQLVTVFTFSFTLRRGPTVSSTKWNKWIPNQSDPMMVCIYNMQFQSEPCNLESIQEICWKLVFKGAGERDREGPTTINCINTT